MSYDQALAYYTKKYRAGGRIGQWLARRDARAYVQWRKGVVRNY